MRALLLFLTTLVFVGCTKDSPRFNGPRWLKTRQVGNMLYTYFYDINGRLDHTNIFNGSSHQTETYMYNAAGRMILSVSPGNLNRYIYDADNRISKHIRINASGKADSVTFVHRNDSTYGFWGNKRYYYYKQRLTGKNYGASPTAYLTSYYYNETPDLAAAALLKSFDVYTLADFEQYTPARLFLVMMRFARPLKCRAVQIF